LGKLAGQSGLSSLAGAKQSHDRVAADALLELPHLLRAGQESHALKYEIFPFKFQIQKSVRHRRKRPVDALVSGD
jgi:hypothetical protein